MRQTVFRVSRKNRRKLLHQVRLASDPATALRFLMVARMGMGVSCRQTAEEFGCVPATAVRVRQRYLAHGWRGLLDGRRHNGTRKVHEGFLEALTRILKKTPPDFGWSRTTWTRELLGLQLARMGFPEVSECTIGRALSAIGARLGSPRPVVLCPWPRAKKEKALARLRRVASRASASEPVFYEDEVDIHLNPKIGRDWMLRGMQRRVVTPGKNRKAYIAGALNAATREVTWVEGSSKNSALFIKLIFALLSANKRARRIHVILDNYGIHSSKRTKHAIAQFGGRVVLHFLPPYCPDANPIERIWRDVHGNVTRNHRCRTIEQLLDDVSNYLRGYNRRARSRTAARLRDSESCAAI